MPKSFPIERRYLVVACAFIIQGVMVGSMFAYGVFFKALEDELGWSRTLLSACFSVSFLTMGIFGIAAGRLSDRFGPRIVMSVSALSFALGYGCMYFVSAPWMLVILYGFLVGIGMASHDVVTLSTVARWFNQRRGLMTAITKIGTASGQMTVPVLASLLIGWVGWRPASAAIGLFALVVLVLAAQGLRRNSDSGGRGVGTDEAAVTYTHAVRTRTFWTFCAIQFCFFPTVVTVPVHIVPHAVDLGMEPTRAAGVISVIGGCSIIGRLLVGTAADRIGGKRAMAICLTVLFCALLFLRLNESGELLFFFAIVYGVAHGGLYTVVSPTLAEYFGTVSHGAIFGVVLFFGTVGGAIGPLLAGKLFDALGSYDIAFATLAGFIFVGLALVLTLRPLRD